MTRTTKDARLYLGLIFVTVIVGVWFLILVYNKQQSQPVTTQTAMQSVQKIPEVQSFLTLVPEARVAVNGDEEDAYLVQVYEIKDGHTATFSWYRVDKSSGVVTQEF